MLPFSEMLFPKRHGQPLTPAPWYPIKVSIPPTSPWPALLSGVILAILVILSPFLAAERSVLHPESCGTGMA